MERERGGGGWKNCAAAELAYQTHGEGWRLGTGADVDLHIRRGGHQRRMCT